MSALRLLIATLLASTALAGAAFAQNDAIRRDVQRDYQVQRPQEREAARPRAERFPGRDDLVGVDRGGPRFIVEAVSFKAVDESGIDYPLTSDEVFAVFSSPTASIVTRNFGNVDTGDTERFRSHENCIWPAVDPDGAENGRWACDPAGGVGPIRFHVALLDDDPEIPLITPPFLGGFCVPGGSAAGGDLSECTTRDWNDTLFEHEFRYETSDIIQRLNPSCRCFTQTARESVDSNTTYEFTFRITMVDGGSDLAVLDERANEGAPPPVHRSGALSAQLNQGFDFDAGILAPAAGADFVFSRSGGAFFLTGGNGAKIWIGGASPRGYATCFAQRMSANYVTGQVALPAAGSYACYVTSDGRVGELQIVSVTGAPVGPAALVIQFTTWQ